MAYQVAFFASPTIEKVNAAISIGTVSYPAYVFIRSEEDPSVGQLGFVDQGNVLKLIKGENKQYVVNVETLPNPSDGDKEVLYICKGIVYLFDGETFNPIYEDKTADIEELDSRVSTLEGKVSTLEETVENLQVTSGLTFVELE